MARERPSDASADGVLTPLPTSNASMFCGYEFHDVPLPA
jgi:hypothetical protein